MKEVIPPSGGPWGGNSVDDKFYHFLNKIIGAKVMEKLQADDPLAFLDIFKEFEFKKKFIHEDTERVTIRMPIGLYELLKKQGKNLGKDTTFLNNSKLRISGDTIRKLFQTTIEAIIKHLEALLCHEKLRDLDSIVMFGGFSDNELVQKAIRKSFGDRQILITENPSFAVLTGAVIYGHLTKPFSIS